MHRLAVGLQVLCDYITVRSHPPKRGRSLALTLLEVAISFCSSLEDVMTGTLQNGSYASLFC